MLIPPSYVSETDTLHPLTGLPLKKLTSHTKANAYSHHMRTLAVDQDPLEFSILFTRLFDQNAFVFVRLTRFIGSPETPIVVDEVLVAVEPVELVFGFRIVQTQPDPGWCIVELGGPKKGGGLFYTEHRSDKAKFLRSSHQSFPFEIALDHDYIRFELQAFLLRLPPSVEQRCHDRIGAHSTVFDKVRWAFTS